MADSQRAEELAFTYCLRRLTSAARTEQDLRAKLAERGYEGGVIDAVLERLVRAGYVNDAEFAQSWVRSRSVHKTLTAPVLRAELRRKGVLEPLIEEALQDLATDDEDERARALLRRKAPATLPRERADRDKVARRLCGVLARKGYSSSRSWSLVSEILDELPVEPGCR
ncbi:MAG: regulatory protein RecX [Cumulibacter sp.]